MCYIHIWCKILLKLNKRMFSVTIGTSNIREKLKEHNLTFHFYKITMETVFNVL